jgi:HSP20 family protein
MNSKEPKSGFTIHRNQWVSVCHHQVHSLFEELIHKTWGHEHWHPAVDVFETAEAFVVELDLPGVEADKVKILLENNRLTIEGQRKAERPNRGTIRLHMAERPIGKFYCCFDLAGPLEMTQISKQYASGIMTIRIPKKK